MTHTTVIRPADASWQAAWRLAAIFALVKLTLHFVATLWSQHLGYGYFRDELYYIICGRHLAWGYVDHGPIAPLQARLGEILFGGSVFAIRIFSAMAGATAVFLTGIIVWAMGGRRPSQSLAMLALLVAPLYLGTDSFLSMNSFEPVFWTVCLLAVIRMPEGSRLRLWLLFGVSAGLGLLNKPSMTFFLIALGLGLLLTPERRILLTRDAGIGIAILLLISAPNVAWQISHHWPTLEFLHNGKLENKNVVLGPIAFVGTQIQDMHPLTLLLWFPGIVALLRSRSLPGFRWLGYTATIFFVLMFGLHAKDYYLAGIYPALFGAGAIAWERRFSRDSAVQQDRVFAFPVYESLLVLSGLILLPMSLPIMRPAQWVAYTKSLHLYGHAGKTETNDEGPLPQFYADRFGWTEEVREVNRIYQSLSADDRARVGISCSNYGEASALNFLAPRMGLTLPIAISGHNNYYLWGPGNATGEVMILISGHTVAELKEFYEGVTVAGSMDHPLAMPYERRSIYLARRRKHPITLATWPEFKAYI